MPESGLESGDPPVRRALFSAVLQGLLEPGPALCVHPQPERLRRDVVALLLLLQPQRLRRYAAIRFAKITSELRLGFQVSCLFAIAAPLGILQLLGVGVDGQGVAIGTHHEHLAQRAERTKREREGQTEIAHGSMNLKWKWKWQGYGSGMAMVMARAWQQ